MSYNCNPVYGHGWGCDGTCGLETTIHRGQRNEADRDSFDDENVVEVIDMTEQARP